MKTTTITYTAAGTNIPAAQTQVYYNDLFSIQGNLIGKEVAIFSIDWVVHCFANYPAIVPYAEIALTRGVNLSYSWLTYGINSAQPVSDYPNMLLLDSFTSIDAKGSKTWPELFPHEMDQRDHIFINLFIDNGQSNVAINPSYRVEITFHYEDLNTIREIRGYR